MGDQQQQQVVIIKKKLVKNLKYAFLVAAHVSPGQYLNMVVYEKTHKRKKKKIVSVFIIIILVKGSLLVDRFVWKEEENIQNTEYTQKKV